ncbi:MAG: hypothetical protein JXR69_01570 [Candidatus Delongbacteria bacterium]|nr:hypothetical protein [Candidatus Delongbacteria bacterium]
MKNLNLFFMGMLVFLAFIFYSCHTETPVNVDFESPEVQRVVIYNCSTLDTIYDSQYFELNLDTTFVHFQDSLKFTTDYGMVISAIDNGTLHKVSLFAEDWLSKISYELESKSADEKGDYLFILNVADLPAVQEINPQKFYLYFSIADESENISNSEKLGYNFEKKYLQEKIFEKFGLLENTGRDSIDFTGKVEQLTFIQFLADG